jgi:centromeric protein E
MYGSASYTGNIKVSVRVKPNAISISPDLSSEPTWVIDSSNGIISTKDVGEFTYDNVFDGPAVLNAQIYSDAVAPLVKEVMQGYHGTVFAYGMTGSGKTFSMQGTPRDPGIIPLSVNSIFEYIDNNTDRAFTVKLSYLEIYNENLNDLLLPASSSEEIKLRDDPLRGVKAIGLKEVEVASAQQLLDYISQGDAVRKTEGTDFNARSSRSHAVVQISINSISNHTIDNVRLDSTLYLCDLAGSERAVSQTERRKEGAFINKSLLTLGTVIARLSTGGSGHVPYRDSKLTRLLQPALSGRALVSVLCTIQTTGYAYAETVSTLRFAARAKNITVSAKRNDQSDPSSKTVERLLQQVAAQKLEIEQLKAGIYSSPVIPTANQNSQLEAENRILHERVEHLSRLCDDSRLEQVLGLSIEESDEDNLRQHQVEEYKSYIAHLEKQLYNQEIHRVMAGQDSQPDYHGYNSNSHYQDIIRDLKEEMEELRESNRDKDRIISALRSSNKRKEAIAGLKSNSSAYSNYYFNSPLSVDGSEDSKENFPSLHQQSFLKEQDLNNLPSNACEI